MTHLSVGTTAPRFAVFRMVNTAKSATLPPRFCLTSSRVFGKVSDRRVLVTPSESPIFGTDPGFGVAEMRKVLPLPSVTWVSQGPR